MRVAGCGSTARHHRGVPAVGLGDAQGRGDLLQEDDHRDAEREPFHHWPGNEREHPPEAQEARSDDEDPGEHTDDHYGIRPETCHERYEAQPIDRQTNGPQLFYGLRYHTHIVKPGEVETFHDQVGYWLWEPATGTVTLLEAIPRAQVPMAVGRAMPDRAAVEPQAHV